MRDLLSRYFTTARQLVDRYGGTIEKFIGDAVMAVWGAPVANEDDAERAVRAALDLAVAVTALGEELGMPDLRMRVGVLTGEAAVTVGAEGQGMVAGDLVNTASRVQALAEPGTVLVGDATRRLSEAAIAYEEAGRHLVKGRDEPVDLHRALWVIAARRGEGRPLALEPPFTGREREFRLVTELFHDSARERRARLVSVVGVAGVGKSRLAWEFEKHIDGLAFDVLWHRGRCLAYGDGVAFWALGEMVRMRARISEEDPPEQAAIKLARLLETYVPDPLERQFLDPRLSHLLGLADRSAADKEDLFSAWRLFFERMAEHNPVVLVFEDVQWADAALLDFIDYLLDWSRAYPIYVLTLARPEGQRQWPRSGAVQREFASVPLEPLSDELMGTVLGGAAPGLPDEVREHVIRHAEGIPLYAVETVRMLVDRGVIERDGAAYRVVGTMQDLEVPDTLQALAAARLDVLSDPERRLLEDAAVLGKTFTRSGLMALSGRSADEVDEVVRSLLRKEILTVQNDPLSPERGQLSFLQDLLRRVAYDTLSMKQRKAKHLAAASHLATELDTAEEEIAAVLAAHYVDALRSGPGDADAPELKARARQALSRAGERAISLAAAGEAARYFAQAADLTEEPYERAGLLEQAGRAAAQSGDREAAYAAFQPAIALLNEAGDRRRAARVEARVAEVLRAQGRVDEALELMRAAYDALAGEQDADLALVAAQLARLIYFSGDLEGALVPVEVAIEIGEALRLAEPLAEALNTKGCLFWRRPHESEALLLESLKIATASDLTAAALRAQFNLSGLAIEHDRLDDARAYLDDSLALARRRGDRSSELFILGQLAEVLHALGEWDQAAEFAVASGEQTGSTAAASMLLVGVRIAVGRGETAAARSLVDRLAREFSTSDVQDQGGFALAQAAVLRAEGRRDESMRTADLAADIWGRLYQVHYLTDAVVEWIEAALDGNDLERAEQRLAEAAAMPPIEQRPALMAHVARLQAKIAGRRGDGTSPDAGFALASEEFRRLKLRYWLAVTQLEHAEWLIGQNRAEDAQPQLDEALITFERLAARPWTERAERLTAEAAGAGAASRAR